MSVGQVTSPLVSSTSPDYTANVGTDLNALAVAVNQLGAYMAPATLIGATDAILFPGADNLVFIKGASALDACTLATPGAADVGKVVTVVSLSAYAHTITTSSGKILDGTATAKDTATFAAHAGASIELQAVYDGTNYFWALVAAVACPLTAV